MQIRTNTLKYVNYKIFQLIHQYENPTTIILHKT
jgi:hypothetical protein